MFYDRSLVTSPSSGHLKNTPSVSSYLSEQTSFSNEELSERLGSFDRVMTQKQEVPPVTTLAAC